MPQRFAFLALLAVLLFTCSAGHAPEVQHFVFDEENLLTAGEEAQLDSLFRAHERITSNEIALVTTPSYNGREDMRAFAASFGDSLGVGKHSKNNGIVIAFSRNLREVFIATGLGAEEVLTEDDCQDIIDRTMLPRFKEERYFQGLFDGGKAVVEFLEEPGHRIK